MSTRKTSKELTVNDLKTLLREKKLPTTGKKKDLQDRLKMYNMSKSELQKKAKAKKLPTTGTKAVLVRRIQSGRASPPRCCNQPQPTKAKKTTSAKCTLGKNGRNYYFKGNPPHKRITDAKAKRIGSGPCVSSSTRTQSQLKPQDKEAIKKIADNLRKSLGSTGKSPTSTRTQSQLNPQDKEAIKKIADNLRKSLGSTGKSPTPMRRTRGTRSMYGSGEGASRAYNLRKSLGSAGKSPTPMRRTRGTRSMYGSGNRASRADNLRRSMRNGGVLKSLNELNPRASADLRRSRAEVRNDLMRQSAGGNISLLKVALDESGTPFFLEELEPRFNPGDGGNVYETYSVKDVEKLATVDSKTADQLRGSRNLDSVPNARLLPDFTKK